MHRFKDFAKKKVLVGDKLKIDEILNQEIIINDFSITKSKVNSGQCLKMQFELNGKNYITFTGSVVLMEELNEYKDELPFVAIIRKVGNHFEFDS